MEAPIRLGSSKNIWQNTRFHVTKIGVLSNTTAVTPNLANLGRLESPTFHRSSCVHVSIYKCFFSSCESYNLQVWRGYGWMAGNGSDVYSEDVWLHSQSKHYLSSHWRYSPYIETKFETFSLLTSCRFPSADILIYYSVSSKHSTVNSLRHYEIYDFRHEESEKCALLNYHAESSSQLHVA